MQARMGIRTLFWLIASLTGVAMAAPTTPTTQQTSHDAAQAAQRAELAHVGVMRYTGQDYKPGYVRHIVMFRYKATTPAAVRTQIRQQFLAMQQQAQRDGQAYILSIETGSQNSGEGADQGLQDAFVVTFRSEGDRNYYVGSPVVTTPGYFEPVHARFKQFAFPYIQSAVVFDYTRTAVVPTVSVPSP